MSLNSIKMMLEFMRHYKHTEITYTFRKNKQPVALVCLKNAEVIQIVFSQMPHEISYYEGIDEAAFVIDKLIN
ncbi:hypothetical protein RRU94_17760 [Domibacillus sp. DTU_2020_1001157_1_SI_ALB_TIR_016]|uniref:hypothetical protein n=1 Tax=Domibacillus sp. DTU_2020_1001157_1_SI_ALB_TIR_016 TaxID=3077789 RepID=UPI0028ECF98A|nr:hypothetical protein [Domibacillus sp. DTU_2020_1001157_1_SI_ALB_TIR_016]WNS79384.1 hypothetical protein RRU94_17760 [Domibacillus sp. DTU_2020_1001157_1_SI_ALB_TIR_016]